MSVCHCEDCRYAATLPATHDDDEPAPLLTLDEQIEQAADFAGVDKAILLLMIQRDWLLARGFMNPTETAPLPAIDWGHAAILRRARGTADSYSDWRRDGNNLVDGEPPAPAPLTS